jgi:hypothetical protein
MKFPHQNGNDGGSDVDVIVLVVVLVLQTDDEDEGSCSCGGGGCCCNASYTIILNWCWENKYSFNCDRNKVAGKREERMTDPTTHPTVTSTTTTTTTTTTELHSLASRVCSSIVYQYHQYCPGHMCHVNGCLSLSTRIQ